MMKILLICFLFLAWCNQAWAALALDGNQNTTSFPANVGTITLSTTNSNVIIGVLVYLGNPLTVTSISDTASNTWILRKRYNPGGGANNVEFWYAISAAKLTSDVITITGSGSTPNTAIAFGVSGANTTSPFDPNGGLPYLLNQATGTHTSYSVTTTTNNANDFLVAALVGNASGCGTSTVPSGFTSFGADSTYVAGSYKIVSSTLSSTAITYTCSINSGGIMFVDAIQQSSINNCANCNEQPIFQGAP